MNNTVVHVYECSDLATSKTLSIHDAKSVFVVNLT